MTDSTQKFLLDLTKERGKIVEFLEKVEQSGKWSERPKALMPTLIRWWKAMRAPEVAKWQQKYRVNWDAKDGRDGGARRAVWEVLMGMERFNGKAKEQDQGALALVLDLAKAFERVSFPVVWAWATHFCFTKNDLAGALRLL